MRSSAWSEWTTAAVSKEAIMLGSEKISGCCCWRSPFDEAQPYRCGRTCRLHVVSHHSCCPRRHTARQSKCSIRDCMIDEAREIKGSASAGVASRPFLHAAAMRASSAIISQDAEKAPYRFKGDTDLVGKQRRAPAFYSWPYDLASA